MLAVNCEGSGGEERALDSLRYLISPWVWAICYRVLCNRGSERPRAPSPTTDLRGPVSFRFRTGDRRREEKEEEEKSRQAA